MFFCYTIVIHVAYLLFPAEVLVRDWLGDGAEDQELERLQEVLEAK